MCRSHKSKHNPFTASPKKTKCEGVTLAGVGQKGRSAASCRWLREHRQARQNPLPAPSVSDDDFNKLANLHPAKAKVRDWREGLTVHRASDLTESLALCKFGSWHSRWVLHNLELQLQGHLVSSTGLSRHCTHVYISTCIYHTHHTHTHDTHTI